MQTIFLCVCGCMGVLCAAAAEWRNLTPDGGRIAHIAVDPQNSSTVYASTCAGLFKSLDSGASWSPTSYEAPPGCDASVPAVTVDPRNAGTLYIAGCAPSKSTDGGATWRVLSGSADHGTCVQAIALDRTNSATVYAAGRRVYKSTDMGESWAAVSDFVVNAASLLADPRNPSVLYAAGSLGVLKSVDGGVTWSASNSGLSGDVDALAIDPSDPQTLYAGAAGRVFRSKNGGAAWQEQSAGLPLPSASSASARLFALAIDPQNEQTIHALLLQVLPGVPSANYRFYYALSSDGAATWTTADDPSLSSTDLTAIAIDPNDRGNLYLGTTDGILKSADGGSRWRWSSAGLKVAAVGSVWADSHIIVAANATRRFTTGGVVFRSADAGRTWDTIDLHARVRQLEADPQNPAAVYAWSGTDLLKTEDAGVHWTTVSSTAEDGDPLAIDPRNASVMYKGVDTCNGICDTRIYKSQDAGRTWARGHFSLNGKSCCSLVSNIAVYPQDSSVVYAGAADYNETGSGLWKSVDGGETWSSFGWGDITGLALHPRDPNTIYTVWNCCVYKTTDGGKTWDQADAGLPHWPTGPVLIDPTDPDTLYCVAYDFDHGRSDVFRSTDGAKTWQPAGAGLRGDVNSITLDRRDPSIVYAGTTSGLYVLAPDSARRPRPARR